MNVDAAYRVLAYIGLAAVLLGLGGYFGYDYAESKNAAKVADSAKRVKEIEDEWQSRFNENARNLVGELNGVIAARDADIERLRQRPPRLPADTRGECQGGTGAELSGPDAEFLTREAARAESIRAALGTCYADLDALRISVNNITCLRVNSQN